ncbi:hypothetical protein BaRGS_00011778 [Batillaria attramentaria]|uniref:protein-tyrosine-phosphatase n=1 Tax=Batillaria attramentaria TaxID=370345 RepID=A0ABD0LBV2_9CAEN
MVDQGPVQNTVESVLNISETPDPCLQCPANSYCFVGSVFRCVACNEACDGCTGPGPDECKACKGGYQALGGTCVRKYHNTDCNGTCHCLDDSACNSVTGECQGKCKKGYYAPPQCQDRCTDGFYGIDCLEVCHCLNDSVCEPELGFCPGNQCHPDWTSVGCGKRLPKLALPPEVVVSTCRYLTVHWRAWNTDDDFGDLPIAEYRLYMLLNGTDPNTGWKPVTTLSHDPSATSYEVNVTSLQGDAYYRFRVNVHYSDDNKVVERASWGLASELYQVPCTTTTEPPPVTIPIILGTEVFDNMAASNEPDGSMGVTWSLDPDLRRFSWNVTLEYQVIGKGDCQTVDDANITSVPVDQTDVSFRVPRPEPWSKYRFTLFAQGNGIISAVNGTESIEAISGEVAPTGVVSSFRLSDTQTRSVTLAWNRVPCAQRGGVLVRYDVTIRPQAGPALSLVTNVTSVTVDGLDPFTNHTANVRYVNSVGAGPYSQDFQFTTLEGIPGPVTINSLVPTESTIVVNFNPPTEANGIIIEYHVLYSELPDFNDTGTATYIACSPQACALKGLNPYTVYYVKVRARTSAGVGPYGQPTQVRTLQARPFPPASLSQNNRTSSCIGIMWDPPDQSSITVIGYTVTLTELGTGLGVVNTTQLDASVTQYVRCGLKPGTSYNVSMYSRSGGGAGERAWAVFTTEHTDPAPPPAPLLVNVSTTTAVVQLSGVVVQPGIDLAYQVEVERIQAGARKKRHPQVPGRVTAQLTRAEVGESYVLVIGDGKTYGGYSNDALLPGQQYNVYYVVLSTFNNETNDDKVDGVLIGVIVALAPPYIELDEEKKKPTLPKAEYDPEKYWNQITSTRESRYIVAGRECLPDSQIAPIGLAQPGAPKVTFRKEFHSLPHKFEQATTLQAEQHPDRNRFPHILPYDHSRVELTKDSNSRCPYINANYMSGYKRQRAYIAAQSPYNDVTAVDFWRLIHQLGLKTVVMIANVVEDNIVKCTQFWPEQEGKVTIGRFLLELLEEMVYADFTVRDISVREGREQHGRIVRLFEFTSWPDHGVPSDPIPFLDMRYKVRQYHGDDPGPILVHCGTGVARTGVFIAVDALIDQYAAEGRISVFSFVRKMRKERPLMVRTYKQYVFIYESIFEEFHAGDTMVDTETLKPKYHEWTQKNYKTSRSYLRDQFQLLQRLTRGPEEAECAAALLPLNAHRNRYPDVVPSDLHRPVLMTPASLSKTDYINAVFVDGYRKRNQFILTQTPLHTTIVDFWRLVYDYRVQTVVMMENYRHESDTCAEYWPTDVNMKQWEPFFIETTAAFQEENVTIRNLKLRNTQRPNEPPRLLRQFQFNAWADNSFTPISKTMAMDLLDLVLDYQENSESPNSPIVVHCEDGATHSGMFVALSLVVDDYDQFRFCYKTLWDYMNLRMPGGTFTETLGQTKTDKLYGVASLSLTSYQDSL